MGDSQGIQYVAVIEKGKPKTLRRDRILQVLQQLTVGHPSSLAAAPTYRTGLPPFPVAGAVFRVLTIAVSSRTGPLT